MATALITGANRGLGLALTEGYVQQGWRVHACCRHPEKAKGLKALRETATGEVISHKLDVTDGLRVASLARELADEPIDLLINNAGILGPRSLIEDPGYDEWLSVFQVNTLAPMRMVDRFVDLVAGSERKLVVNISSRMGSIACCSGGGQYIYRSSKAALNMVSKMLSLNLADRGITVVMLHPGWVQTDMGGEEATLTIDESRDHMMRVIDGLGPADNGRFLSFDGSEIPW